MQEWTNFKTDSMRYYTWDRNAEIRLTSAYHPIPQARPADR
jgi:hypothetical protein